MLARPARVKRYRLQHGAECTTAGCGHPLLFEWEWTAEGVQVDILCKRCKTIQSFVLMRE